MIKLNRHFMTLMEVLVAITVTMLLLTAITAIYRQMHFINKESEALEKEHFSLSYLEKRLSGIIPKAISPRDVHRDFYFFTSNSFTDSDFLSLIFVFDRGANLKSEHSNHVLGRLFLDRDKNLVLATWCSPKRWEASPLPEMTKEILMENVSHLSFEFYVPPKASRDLIIKRLKTDTIQENSWHKSWNASYKQLPALVRILMTKNEKPLTFSYPLPKSDFVIMYEG